MEHCAMQPAGSPVGTGMHTNTAYPGAGDGRFSLVRRLRPERRIFGSRFAGVLPAVSASVIVLAGVLITSRAIPQLG